VLGDVGDDELDIVTVNSDAHTVSVSLAMATARSSPWSNIPRITHRAHWLPSYVVHD
jgi:hypothetical protein